MRPCPCRSLRRLLISLYKCLKPSMSLFAAQARHCKMNVMWVASPCYSARRIAPQSVELIQYNLLHCHRHSQHELVASVARTSACTCMEYKQALQMYPRLLHKPTLYEGHTLLIRGWIASRPRVHSWTKKFRKEGSQGYTP